MNNNQIKNNNKIMNNNSKNLLDINKRLHFLIIFQIVQLKRV